MAAPGAAVALSPARARDDPYLFREIYRRMPPAAHDPAQALANERSPGRAGGFLFRLIKAVNN
jgi:hypothetical protein